MLTRVRQAMDLIDQAITLAETQHDVSAKELLERAKSNLMIITWSRSEEPVTSPEEIKRRILDLLEHDG